MSLTFPYTPTAPLFHRFGGRILEVVGIGRTLGRMVEGRSGDSWHYLARVQWDDGSGDPREVMEVEPFKVCADSDAGIDECNALARTLTDYLNERGEWLSDGRGWRAHRTAKGA